MSVNELGSDGVAQVVSCYVSCPAVTQPHSVFGVPVSLA
jgi:hypothetical protein